MRLYVVVNCPRCGDLMLARTTNRTRTCPRCGRRAEIRSLKILAKTDSPRQAVELIQSLKEKEKARKS